MPKYARMGTLSKERDYLCAKPWPENCFVQAGERGIVIDSSGGEHYETAFFEAFPRAPDTFIRGEGASVSEAEEKAWAKYQRYLACPGHEFERRGYKNGAGFCKHCNMFKSQAFEPETKCCTCQKPTYFTSDADNNWYCEEHQRDKPLEKWTGIDWHIAYMDYDSWCFHHGQRPSWEMS